MLTAAIELTFAFTGVWVTATVPTTTIFRFEASPPALTLAPEAAKVPPTLMVAGALGTMVTVSSHASAKTPQV